MKLYRLSHSEVCRIRNLLCREICWLEHCKALDPESPPEGVTKRQARRNAKAVGYDRTALAAISQDGEARLEDYRRGPFARRIRIAENRQRKREKLYQKKYSTGRAIFNLVFEKVAKKEGWRVVK